VLFSSFLGYNPLQQVLGPTVLGHLPAGHAAVLTSRSYFPHLMATPFHDGLSVAFGFAIAANVLAAVASAFTGGRRHRHAPAPAAAGAAAPAVTPAAGTAAPAVSPAGPVPPSGTGPPAGGGQAADTEPAAPPPSPQSPAGSPPG